jgi:hypothetical protein
MRYPAILQAVLSAHWGADRERWSPLVDANNKASVLVDEGEKAVNGNRRTGERALTALAMVGKATMGVDGVPTDDGSWAEALNCSEGSNSASSERSRSLGSGRNMTGGTGQHTRGEGGCSGKKCGKGVSKSSKVGAGGADGTGGCVLAQEMFPWILQHTPKEVDGARLALAACYAPASALQGEELRAAIEQREDKVLVTGMLKYASGGRKWTNKLAEGLGVWEKLKMAKFVGLLHLRG